MSKVECWGHIVDLPEPNIVGKCEVCGGDIYDYAEAMCPDCDRQVHIACLTHCEQCGHTGCKKCMLYDAETCEYFCDVASNGVLKDSECYQDWIEQ